MKVYLLILRCKQILPSSLIPKMMPFQDKIEDKIYKYQHEWKYINNGKVGYQNEIEVLIRDEVNHLQFAKT